MKKCDYCAGEIGYNDIYCSDECERLAKEYYEKRVKSRKLMGIIYACGTVFIGVGIFLYAMTNVVGAFFGAAGALSMGSATLILPSPPDEVIRKHKLKKSVFLIRIFGAVLLCFGAAALVLGIIKI